MQKIIKNVPYQESQIIFWKEFYTDKFPFNLPFLIFIFKLNFNNFVKNY